MAVVRRFAVPEHRLSVAARILAAVAGGYALTSLITLALSHLLPRAGVLQAEAVLASTMVSFLIYAVIVMAVFHARTAWRAWLGLIVGAIPCGLAIGLSMLPAAR